MSNVQSIFGLKSSQVFNPQVFDVKLLFDQRELVRLRAQKAIASGKMLKEQLGNCRDIAQRRVLYIELEVCLRDVCSLKALHSQIHKEALCIEKLFYKCLERSQNEKFRAAA